MKRTILVTGGCGYIGSHTCLDLLQHGHDVVVVDNLCNSSRQALGYVADIAGRKIPLHEIDLRDGAALRALFLLYSVDAVLHFAGLKAVGESIEKPLEYYHNNLVGTLELLQVMREHGVKRFVFSSSATVYGVPDAVPIAEDAPVRVTNPYGRTKLMVEEILQDVHQADPEWSIALLRYFNPVGGHASGLLGERPHGVPNNLMPYICQVASGRLAQLRVFGADYPTRDGTGVRDYIHVQDLAEGHTLAVEQLMAQPGLRIWNLGTGTGYSVLEMVRAFEQINNVAVPYQISPRRDGDVAECYANPNKARTELKWVAKRGLEEMVRDAWAGERMQQVAERTQEV
ncbi:UDP-glucose 4-epimerase GalE [Megalodesulfovibrio paquesii]